MLRNCLLFLPLHMFLSLIGILVNKKQIKQYIYYLVLKYVESFSLCESLHFTISVSYRHPVSCNLPILREGKKILHDSNSELKRTGARNSIIFIVIYSKMSYLLLLQGICDLFLTR